MFEECPHCHIAVLAKQDGTCPSCLKNINESSEDDLMMTRLTIHSGQTLPTICVKCGAETTNRKKVITKSYEKDAEKNKKWNDPWIRWSTGIFGWIFYLLSRDTRYPYFIPLCGTCDRDEPIDLLDVNLVNGSIDILAHRDFVKKLQ